MAISLASLNRRNSPKVPICVLQPARLGQDDVRLRQ